MKILQEIDEKVHDSLLDLIGDIWRYRTIYLDSKLNSYISLNTFAPTADIISRFGDLIHNKTKSLPRRVRGKDK